MHAGKRRRVTFADARSRWTVRLLREPPDGADVRAVVNPGQHVVGDGLRGEQQRRLAGHRPKQIDPRPEPTRRQRVSRTQVITCGPRPEHEQRSRCRIRCRVSHGVHDRPMARTYTTHQTSLRRLPTSPGVGYHRHMDVVAVLLVVLVLVFIWRGPKTLPQIGSVLGRGVKSAREEARAIRKGEAVGPDEADSTDAAPRGSSRAVARAPRTR